MSETTAGQWAWAEDPRLVMWCVTFTRAITAPDALARYGADPQVARLLDRDQANSLYAATTQEGSVLRAGSLGMWSFCFEEHGITGAMSGTCTALSEGTETLSLLHGADGMNSFAHWRDGRRVERFEFRHDLHEASTTTPLVGRCRGSPRHTSSAAFPADVGPGGGDDTHRCRARLPHRQRAAAHRNSSDQQETSLAGPPACHQPPSAWASAPQPRVRPTSASDG
ncbi:DUF6461 domain-containing protein [Micromonospora sp. LOL_024]|uniref:DUF6461 domain-containing protein n=1 Tax=Micromonospora sp. LOL_024 TaxID=3345412 RepID=UPI003A883C38